MSSQLARLSMQLLYWKSHNWQPTGLQLITTSEFQSPPSQIDIKIYVKYDVKKQVKCADQTDVKNLT